MTTTAVVPSSTPTLSPIPEDSATKALIDSLVSFRHGDGKYELRRSLSAGERQSLKSRSSDLTAHMKAARADYIVDCVLAMLIGFGGARASADDAKAIATQYASVLYGLPGWALKRSCNLWASGQVTPDMIGAKTIDRSFAPSAAQVRMVAEDVVRPFMQEYARINKTLMGVVAPHEMTPEERHAAADKLQEIADDFGARIAASELQQAERDAAAAARAMKRTDDLILAEYHARGIEPPPGNLVSLSTLLSIGWTIEEGRLFKPKEKKPRGKAKDSRGAGDESQTVGA